MAQVRMKSKSLIKIDSMKKIIAGLVLILPFMGLAQNSSSNNDARTVVQKMPTFNGDLSAWLSTHLSYPKSAEGKSGRVMVTFVVEKDGSVTGVKVIQSVYPSLDSAAVACVMSMPKWTPGLQNDSPVRVQFNLPINFQMPVIEQSSQNPDTPPRVK